MSDQPMFTTSDVNKFSPTSWEHNAFAAFESQLCGVGEEQFPCVFGVEAAKRETLRFGFFESLHFDQLFRLAYDLLSFLKISRTLLPYTSYVAFFHPERVAFLVMDEYENAFWRVLNLLNSVDSTHWPSCIDSAVDTPSWEFSFAGEPMFVVCNTPLHQRRRSRYSPGFTITFQPRYSIGSGQEPRREIEHGQRFGGG
jgi:FPC/CPF motif-containing protein YcgG